jgi:hypothetical protein
MPSTSYQRHSSSRYRPVPHATSTREVAFGECRWMKAGRVQRGPVVVRTTDQVVQLRGFTGPGSTSAIGSLIDSRAICFVSVRSCLRRQPGHTLSCATVNVEMPMTLEAREQ